MYSPGQHPITLPALAILAALAVSVFPSHASASDFGPDLDLGGDDAIILGGIALAYGGATFVVMDIIQAARGRPLPQNWAAVELVVGLAITAASVPLMMYDGGDSQRTTTGIFAMLGGLGLSTHAVLTLYSGADSRGKARKHRHTDEPDADRWWLRTESRASVQLDVVPQTDGAGVQMSGRF